MKARKTYETRKKRERTMGEFLTRAISVVAVVVCLNGYNTVLDKREQEQEQSVDAAKEGTITDGAYKDGTYTGEAQGFGGPVDVEVIVENGMISEINIASAEKEDGAYLSMAEDIIPTILEAQSAEVDIISGATFSSTGIKEAVAQALEEAANQED